MVDKLKNPRHKIYIVIKCIRLQLAFIIIFEMRVATMRPLIYIIYFELVLISHASPQVKANDKGNSVDPPTILMSN